MAKDAGNSEKTVKGTPFKPGQSGNPSGRPKVPLDLVAKCKDITPEVINFWIDLMRDSNEKAADRLRASENIIERGFGKARQAMELTGEDGGPVEIIKRIIMKAGDVDPQS
jgi:hypothetical protein